MAGCSQPSAETPPAAPPKDLKELARRSLAEIDGTLKIAGLQQPVQVIRDEWGVPHIYAQNTDDLFLAQGYVMAQDRLWQMDLLRRVARGQLSEILGSSTVSIDKHFRLLRFGPAAERDVALLDEESRGVMEAYSRGVNQFIEQHQNNLPVEFKLLKYRPQPWQPTDSVVIGAYMYETLTETWEEKLNRAQVTARAGPRCPWRGASRTSRSRPSGPVGWCRTRRPRT